jgi:hypothetical protein
MVRTKHFYVGKAVLVIASRYENELGTGDKATRIDLATRL